MREGWIETELMNVCTLQRGFDLPKKERTSGAVPLMSSSGAIDSVNSAKVTGPGVVTGRSGSIGQVYFIEDNFWPLNTTLYVRDFHGNDPRFVYYLLSNFDLRRFASGAGVPTLNRNHIHDELVRVPTRICEQKRIVAILDEAFAGIATAVANTEKNLANARELFESYLNAVFMKNADVWARHRLEEVCEKITVGHVGSMARRYKPVGIPLLRSQNIRPFRVDLENVVYIDEEFHAELKKSALKPGDLGIVRTGYPGTAALVPESLPVANCSDLVIVRPGDQVLGSFLELVFNSSFGKRAVAGVLVGAAQKHFNVTAAKAALVPVPSRDEQERVVSESSDVRTECERLERNCAQKLNALAELKQSLLQKAFSGELTAYKEASDAMRQAEEIV